MSSHRQPSEGHLAVHPLPVHKPQPSFGERVRRLNKKRQEMIRPVQEHPRDFVLLTIRGLASRLGTDPATVVRVVRALGFAGYREFKAYLHELSIATATSLDAMRSDDHSPSSLGSLGSSALEMDLKNLQALRNTLDLPRIEALVRRLYRARRIVVIAGDMASGLADALDYKFTLLGLPSISAVSAGRIFHVVGALGKGDLVIAITFQRGLRQTIEGLKQASGNGAYCVAITNSAASPAARFADEYFLTPVQAPFSQSYAAPHALINVLMTVCANHRRGRTLSILKRVDREQRTGFRWYND